VDNAVSDSLRERLLSFFPEGTFARVDVLGYGDDPAVEPGDTAIRVFIDRAGRPEEDWDSRETLHEWADANSEGIGKIHAGLLPSIAWIQFYPGTPERLAMPARPNWGGMSWLGKPPDPMESSPEFARVATLLGPEDLAAVDALIVAGIVASRADALRWAVGRIREHPDRELLAGEVGGAAAENEFLDLAGRGLRELVDERHGAWRLEVGQPVADERYQLRLRRGLARTQHHERVRRLAPPLARHPDDRDLRHGRVTQQRAFHLDR
jgi:hypothetical protein